MSEMEEKLGSILNNPQMMQQILSMAQQMQSQPGGDPPRKPEPEPQDSPGFDHRMLQSLAGIASANRADPNQQALLKALTPYLSRNRVEKLERAMRAARLAGAASAFLNSGGLSILAGR